MKKSNWYFMGDFAHRNNKKLYDIIKCFTSSERKLLFRHYYFKLDDLSDELKSEIVDQDFNSFCKGVVLYHNPENRIKTELKVKDMLYENLKEKSSLNYYEIEEIKQDLFVKLCNNELSDTHVNNLNSIKEFISKSISEEDVPEIRNFITEREVTKNTMEISYGIDNMHNPVDCIWYCPKNDFELLKAIELEEFLQCIVVENIANLDEYLYAFDFFEQNNYVLAVNDRCGDFVDKIEPKIKKLLDERDFILDEEAYLEKPIG